MPKPRRIVTADTALPASERANFEQALRIAMADAAHYQRRMIAERTLRFRALDLLVSGQADYARALLAGERD
ncbi:hypothetical protein [Sinorhizobium meliloti]|uniref:hypothetical protein n=1 Tax=Rhizobium meliloti TaxID=382 RepID=UPI00299E9BC7